MMASVKAWNGPGINADAVTQGSMQMCAVRKYLLCHGVRTSGAHRDSLVAKGLVAVRLLKELGTAVEGRERLRLRAHHSDSAAARRWLSLPLTFQTGPHYLPILIQTHRPPPLHPEPMARH